MKRAAINLLIALTLAVGMKATEAGAQGAPPDLDVAVSLGDTVLQDGTLTLQDNVFLVGEPIYVSITVKNSGGDFITSKGLKGRDFYLDLVFTGPGGEEIRTHATELDGQHTPPPPRVFYVLGKPLQIEPVEIIQGGWIGGSEPFLALDWYDLSTLGPYSLRAEFTIRTYPAVTQTINQEPYAEFASSDWEGTVVSNEVPFLFGSDNDGDGILAPWDDCDDADPAIPGPSEIPGNGKDDDCDEGTPDQPPVPPGRVDIRAYRHIVGQGSFPGTVDEPLQSLGVRVYDTTEGSCARGIGTSWKEFPSIWLSCIATPDMREKTDEFGMVSFFLEPGKEYIALAEVDGPAGEEPVYLKAVTGLMESDETKKKHMKLLVKANGKKSPGKVTKRTGSELLIIEPEYVEWDGTEELYPFVFESVGDWEVTTSVAPPEGFVADSTALAEDVNAEVEAVQFKITDVGSEWVATGVLHEVRHKGKTEKIRSKVDVKLSKKLAKKKGLTRYGKLLKEKDRKKGKMKK